MRELDPIEDSECLEIAKEILENLIEKMGIEASVEIGSLPVTYTDEQEANSAVLNVTGNDTGSLIGRKGQTLEAIQYIVRIIISKQSKSKQQIVVDVDNYRQKRYEDLKILALNIAEQVKAKNSSLKLEPMSPFERRIIHMTLADDPDIKTESIGEGELRKVVVLPR